MVLEHPWLPLQQHVEREANQGVGEAAKNLSGGTRSELGRNCRHTNASLKRPGSSTGKRFANDLKDQADWSESGFRD